jgi:hypothetical protein
MRWRENGSLGAPWRLVTALAVGGLFMAVTVGIAGAAGSGATPAQKAQAKKALLVLSDLPAGWTSSPSTTASGASFTGAPQLARCIGVPTNLIKMQSPQVNGLQFSDKGGADQVQNTISIFPSATYANEEYTAVASHKTPQCLASLLNSGSSPIGGGGASVTRAPSPKGTSAYAVVIAGSSGSSGGGPSPATRTETVFFVHGQYGDAISIVTLGSQGAPASLVNHLTAEAQGRL